MYTQGNHRPLCFACKPAFRQESADGAKARSRFGRSREIGKRREKSNDVGFDGGEKTKADAAGAQ